jgi:hypothetical protein
MATPTRTNEIERARNIAVGATDSITRLSTSETSESALHAVKVRKCLSPKLNHTVSHVLVGGRSFHDVSASVPEVD